MKIANGDTITVKASTMEQLRELADAEGITVDAALEKHINLAWVRLTSLRCYRCGVRYVRTAGHNC